MMLKWHVQPCVRYCYNRRKLMKSHRREMNIQIVFVQCDFDI